MMRVVLSFIVMCFLTAQASAVCTVGAMPFILQNNTVADATQVMANFNQIVNGVGTTCAASGVNNDITSLGGLTTPLSPSVGGTTAFIGSTSTGTNAIIIATTTPTAFTLTAGNRVHFIAGGTNTAAATVTVGATTTQNLFRRNQFGISTTQGGEIIATQPYTLYYDGTRFVILNEKFIIGEMKDYALAGAPPGWLVADGSAISRTAFVDLFNQIGTNYGAGDGSTTFNIPDTRGRVLAGLDNYGTGAAGRLTNAGTGCGTAFNSPGVSCANGSQSHTQIIAEIAAHNHAASDSGHTHSYQETTSASATASAGSQPVALSAATTGVGFANISVGNAGSGQAMPIVNPNLGVTKIIKF